MIGRLAQAAAENTARPGIKQRGDWPERRIAALSVGFTGFAVDYLVVVEGVLTVTKLENAVEVRFRAGRTLKMYSVRGSMGPKT